MRSAGMASVNPSNPELAQLLEAGAEVSAFEAAAKTAVDQGKGFGYALGIVRNQLADAARMAADVREVTAGRKRSTAAQTESFRERDQRLACERVAAFAPGAAARPVVVAAESGMVVDAEVRRVGA